MGNTVPISIVIPTMNRPETLERTLASYAVGDSVPEQIIIVDQTGEETVRLRVELVAGKYGAEYYYLEIPSSTAARNEGIQHIIHEIIVFSDDDVDVYADTVKNVWNTMQRKDVALIGGLDDNSGASGTNIGYLLGTKSFRKRRTGHVTASILGRYPDQVRGEIPTEWAMGYFFVCRKSKLLQWNICWDERLVGYAYAEDLDFSFRYCKRAKEEGLKCILSDQVRLRHNVSREYRIPSRKSTYMYAVHRRYIADKNNMGSKWAIAWCDFWRIVERGVKRENPGELMKAIRVACKLGKNNYTDMENIIGKA